MTVVEVVRKDNEIVAATALCDDPSHEPIEETTEFEDEKSAKERSVKLGFPNNPRQMIEFLRSQGIADDKS